MMKTDLEIFDEICKENRDIYISKNKDYGKSVSTTYNDFGIVSFIVRLTDKMERIKTLYKNGEQNVSDEKMVDTLRDLSNYAILAMIEERKKES